MNNSLRVKKQTRGVKIFLFSFFICAEINAQQFTSGVKQFINVNADTIILTHAKIVDGTGSAAKTDQTIVIIKGHIVQLGNSSTIKPLTAAQIIDCTGKTIIPGMVMMHEQLLYGESVPPHYLGIAMLVSFPKLSLAGGVTTMRRTGSVEPP